MRPPSPPRPFRCTPSPAPWSTPSLTLKRPPYTICPRSSSAGTPSRSLSAMTRCWKAQHRPERHCPHRGGHQGRREGAGRRRREHHHQRALHLHCRDHQGLLQEKERVSCPLPIRSTAGDQPLAGPADLRGGHVPCLLHLHGHRRLRRDRLGERRPVRRRLAPARHRLEGLYRRHDDYTAATEALDASWGWTPKRRL